MRLLSFVAFALFAVQGSIAFAETGKTTADVNDAVSPFSKWVLTPSIGYSSLGETGNLNSRLSFSNRSAFTFDVSVSTPVADNVSFSVGADFLQTGADATSKASGHKTLFQRNYAGIPLAMKWDFARFQEGRSAVYLKGGLIPAVLISSSTKYSDGTSENLYGTRFVFFGTAGLGARLPITKGTSIDTTVAYLYGLTSSISSSDDGIHVNGVMLTAGVNVGI